MSNQAANYLTYDEYLKSRWWRELRQHVLWLHGGRCQLCGKEAPEDELQVHHLRRDRLGDERPSDVTLLCRRCHQLIEDDLLDRVVDEANRR